jgi:hypothetical protein
MESTTLPLSSRLPRRAVGPKRRDLRFYGPLLEMFFGARYSEAGFVESVCL